MKPLHHPPTTYTLEGVSIAEEAVDTSKVTTVDANLVNQPNNTRSSGSRKKSQETTPILLHPRHTITVTGWVPVPSISGGRYPITCLPTHHNTCMLAGRASPLMLPNKPRLTLPQPKSLLQFFSRTSTPPVATQHLHPLPPPHPVTLLYIFSHKKLTSPTTCPSHAALSLQYPMNLVSYSSPFHHTSTAMNFSALV